MAFWEIVTISVIGALIYKGKKEVEERAEEERCRISTPCSFSDGISREQFEEIVRKSGRHIKRLTNLSVNGTIVYGTVRAQSGLSEWNFKVDFNDYGHLTGQYWLTSDNDDSNIPSHVADNISSMIREFPKGFENTFSRTNTRSSEYINDEIEYAYDEEQQNLEKTKQQALAFKEKKRERRRKKVKHFVIGLILAFAVALALFIAYEVWEYKKGIEVGISSSQVVGMDYEKVADSFEDAGFTNIHAIPEHDLELSDIDKENTVIQVTVKGDTEFEAKEKRPYDAKVEITYHALKNIYVPISAEDAEGMNYEELVSLLKEAGFAKITTNPEYDLITGWIKKEYSVKSISINGETDFSESSFFRPDAEVIILYHRFKSDKEEETR